MVGVAAAFVADNELAADEGVEDTAEDESADTETVINGFCRGSNGFPPSDTALDSGMTALIVSVDATTTPPVS